MSTEKADYAEAAAVLRDMSLSTDERMRYIEITAHERILMKHWRSYSFLKLDIDITGIGAFIGIIDEGRGEFTAETRRLDTVGDPSGVTECHGLKVDIRVVMDNYQGSRSRRESDTGNIEIGRRDASVRKGNQVTFLSVHLVDDGFSVANEDACCKSPPAAGLSSSSEIRSILVDTI
ncbi:hypothetical protein BDB01DRAFT_836561 [Pilobolus umbonatus]|nr:hypothetical protein BDB01DRAFT_836561 [Pilobolus umbonatus]